MTKTFEVVGTTTAPIDVVWSLLGDSSTWPSWTTIDEYTPDRPADADGLHEVRRFRTGRKVFVEEIVERREPARLSYTLLAGIAVRDYRADVDLQQAPDGGTQITWHTEFESKIPGLGWLYRSTLLSFTQKFVDGLARESEKRSGRSGLS